MEAPRAKEAAKKQLGEIQARSSDVLEVTETLRDVRIQNHFAEHLHAAMGGRKG